MITINNKEYNIKFSLRTMLIYERISGKSVAEITTLFDQIVYLYSALLAADPEIDMTFDDLVTIIDDDMSVLEQFQNEIINKNKKESVFSKEENTNDDKKKS